MDGGTASVLAGLAALVSGVTVAVIGKKGSSDTTRQTATHDYRKQRRGDRQPAYEAFATNVRAFASTAIDKGNELKAATAAGAEPIPQPQIAEFLDMGEVFADSAMRVRLLGPKEVADAVEDVLSACADVVATLSGYANLVHAFPGFPVDEMNIIHVGQFHTYGEVIAASQRLQVSVQRFLETARAHMDSWDGETI
ncbi:hypothetical protein [Streptomyces violaceusniger]|uniref:Uncharacterized protein n=1 Tax=Streptomyces violaceusniger TaxID=68280 RepID=A0A4D4LI25_STRVO|nr:hypothetical protein SVIO_112280 [Streptomyces violaceusniger]